MLLSILKFKLHRIHRDPSRVVPVTELAALFIKGLCELAVQLTGVSVQRSVISVPADYNSYKRSYVYRAATAVGVGVQAVVNEPTASASVLEHKILLKNDVVKTVRFSRQNLADLALPFISRTLRIFVVLLDGRENGSVTAVLVGGSSVLPGVADSVAMLPPIKNVIFERGTYRAAIAIGAAIYAQSFSAAARYRLVDAVSASLSDERRPMLAELILHPLFELYPLRHKFRQYPSEYLV